MTEQSFIMLAILFGGFFIGVHMLTALWLWLHH